MSKQKKPARSSTPAEGSEQQSPGPALGELSQQSTLGNQALQASLSGSVEGGGRSVAAVARAMVEGTALALRVPPRDAAWTREMVQRLERSQLPAERIAAIVARLQGDQARADAVRDAVVRHVGGDSEALRSSLVAGLDDLASELAGDLGGAAALGADADRQATERIGVMAEERLGSELEDVATAEAVRGLCGALSMLLMFGFDEEEEDAAVAGNYAHEESGV